MINIVIDGFAQAQRAPQGVIIPPLPNTIECDECHSPNQVDLRRKHSVRMYTPAEVRKWQDQAKLFAANQMHGRPPLQGGLIVSIKVFLPPPKSMSKRDRAAALTDMLRPITRPDCDNYSKAICDALNGIVWLDDAQIVSLHVGKYYGERPRVEIEVNEWVTANEGLFDGK